MEVHIGKTISNGIAIGRIYLFEKNTYQVSKRMVSDAEKEVIRFEEAKTAVIDQLNLLGERTSEKVNNSQSELFHAYTMIIEDISYNNKIHHMIRRDHVNAEYAVAYVSEEYVKAFQGKEDEYFKEKSNDIKDITDQLVAMLVGKEKNSYLSDEPVIIFADYLYPSDVIQMDRDKVLAFVTQQGSRYSHTSILIKNMNIPSIMGIELKKDWHGKIAIIDGEEGMFIIDPDKKTIKEYQNRVNAENNRVYDEICFKEKAVKVCANVQCIEDIKNIKKYGADGIGLFRSEYLCLSKGNYPIEEEQFEIYKSLAVEMGDKEVVIRTFDIGSDKNIISFADEYEKNPAMGYRGIRISLNEKDIFKTQLRAIYRAAVYGNISIMFPMITSIKEIQDIKCICKEVKNELKSLGVSYKDIDLGIMIETPAAAIISDLLANEVDFFSIGTNDLTQYTLALDRNNIKLVDFYDPRHPAILRMIQSIITNGHKEGCRVGICGDLAEDETIIEILIQMGIDEVSVSPNQIPFIREKL